MPGKVSVEPRSNGVFGDDRVGAMMAKYDADKSGSFNAEECARPHVATHTADSLVHDPPTALTRIPPCFPAHRINPPHRPAPLRVRRIVNDVAASEKSNSLLKKFSGALVLILLAMTGALFGVSYAAGESLKESHVRPTPL